MALIWAENWQGFGSSFRSNPLLFNGLYADSGQFNLDPDPEPGVDTVVMVFASALFGTSLRKVFPGGAYAKVGQAFRQWLDNLPPTDDDVAILKFKNVSNQTLFYINTMNDGRLRIGTDAGVLATTPAPVVTANAWWHIEVLVNFAGGENNVQVRVEGVPVITATYAFPPGTLCGQAEYSTRCAGRPVWRVKDWVIYNGLGDYNKDFLGAVTVFDLAPDVDDTLGWATTGPNGFSVLDNNPPNDAAFISANDPPPPASVFGLQDLPPDITSVRGIVSITRVRKIDGGDGSVQTSLISKEGNEQAGLDRPITAAFTYYPDIFETDPSTGAPWLPNDLNDAKVKLNRTL